MREDGGYYGDDLDDHLVLAYVGGIDGEAFGGGDGAQAGDEEFPSDDDDGDPGRHDARGVGDQNDVGRGDH